MKKLAFFLLMSMMVMMGACSQEKPGATDSFVFVQGGTFLNSKSNYHGQDATVADFYIGKFEVTQKEWIDVMGYNPSAFQGERLPVEMVSWYSAIEYCIKRSIKEGLEPYYRIDKSKMDSHITSEYDDVKWIVTINEGASGYRLPTEMEWEYAASGGHLSKGFTYSGSDHADDVAWYWRNAGDQYLSGDWNWHSIESNKNRTKSVGAKEPNELGLYDMSGNVREWIWDWYEDADIGSGVYRGVRGGGWIGDVSNNEIAFRGKFEANGFGPDQGLRVVRSG